MQRFFALIALLVFSIPVGMSIAGCGSNPNDFCTRNGFGYGLKTTDVASISLGPASTGISLAYGQTGQLNQPTATNCNGGSVSVAHYIYGSNNLNLADINPGTGAICAGTWNRHSASGIPDFTICTPPTGPGTATVTASASAVTSNPVTVYVHPPVTAISIPTQQNCVSQNQTLPAPLTQGTQVFSADGAIDPQYVGTVTYTPVDSTVVTINNTSNGTTGSDSGTSTTSTVNGLATAHLPGSTVINATVSGVTSAAGYFYTCAPKSINLSLNGSDGKPTPVTVNASSPQNLTTSMTDTTGATITGLSLDYVSTEPKQIAVSSAGTVTPSFPTTTTISAICQPGTCNPAPVNIIGQMGNGMPVTSNTVIVNTPGRSSSKLWLASSQSSYFTPIDLTATGTPTPIKLPYIPNSMVLDQAGTNLYFGSYHELMIVSAATNTLTKEDPSVPGVVLAVSPDSSTAVINDQVRRIIYLYKTTTTPASTSGGTPTTTVTISSIGGLATRAAFSPDGKNLYAVGPTTASGKATLYVNNTATGWSTYDISPNEPATTTCNLNNNDPTTQGNNPFDPFCSPSVALTVPSVGPFLSGTLTTARSFCPSKTANPPYYPPAATVNAATDQLTATNDGQHILGATASPAQITDIQFTGTGPNGEPPTVPTGACPAIDSGTPLQFPTTFFQSPLTDIAPTEITGIVPDTDSSVAFVTYNMSSGATGLLPAYKPSSAADAAGTLSNVQLSTGAQAPIVGAFSPDNSTFFVGTSGDNLLHLVDVPTLTDKQKIDPKLTDPNGNPVPVQFIAVQPRTTT